MSKSIFWRYFEMAYPESSHICVRLLFSQLILFQTRKCFLPKVFHHQIVLPHVFAAANICCPRCVNCALPVLYGREQFINLCTPEQSSPGQLENSPSLPTYPPLLCGLKGQIPRNFYNKLVIYIFT